MPPPRSALAAALVAAFVGLLLGGCSGAPQAKPATLATPRPSVTAQTSVSVTEAATTKAPRTMLRVGQWAEVAYRATPTKTYRFRLRVVGVRKGSLLDLSRYVLHRRVRSSSVYYVDVHATNVGRRNAGGTRLRLFGLDTRGVVLPPVMFRGPFPRCDTTRLPQQFRPGDSAHGCLVYLVPRHGHLAAVQVRYGKWEGTLTWQVAGQVQRRHRSATD